MAKQLESLIAKGRRAKRPPEQKEVAFGLADLSTYGNLHDILLNELLFTSIVCRGIT